MAYNAGSVSAKIEIDTSEFDKSIRKLIDDVGKLKGELSNSGADQLSKDVEVLKTNFNDLSESVNKLVSVNNDYKKQLNSLRTENKKLNEDLSSQSKLYDNLGKSAKNYGKEISKLNSKQLKIGFKPNGKYNSEMAEALKLEGMKTAYHQYDLMVRESAQKEKLAWQTRQSAMRNAAENYTNMVRNQIIANRQFFATEGGYSSYIRTLGMVANAFGKVTNASKQISSIGKSFREAQRDIYNSTTIIKIGLKEIGETGTFEQVVEGIYKVSEVLKKLDFTLIETQGQLSKAAKNAIELSSAMWRLNSQGTANWKGRQSVGGYSNYIKSVSNINSELTKQAKLAKEAELATKGLSQAYNTTGRNLNYYKANVTQINRLIDEQRLKTARLEATQQSLALKYTKNNINTYRANMNQINEAVARQTGQTSKLNSELGKSNNAYRTGQMSMREFGTNMGKAEAYSNNLYRSLQKVRSVIVSIKTIAAMMGAMAIWNFGFELIEGVKETYAAKSEMDSLLKQTKWYNKGDLQGINDIHNALDKVTKDFQRINKYSLGETAASIGLEFNLKPDEIAKSARIIAMVQNEYARAGRTNEEAALAVKDILQGEFRRLSMETGVGKEELQEKYGWNGKKEDVMNLLEALEKAGKDRHWDIFAAKATSLNDVITITKNRFGELGADLVSNVEPLILSAFNGLMDGIDALKGHFEGLGSFGKTFTIGGGALGGFVAISTALMMFKRNMGLAEIATLGWGRSFGTALMGLNKVEVATYGFKKTLLATISGTNAATVANNGLAKSLIARVAGLNQTIVAEKGLSKALTQKIISLRGYTSITGMNNVVQKENINLQKASLLNLDKTGIITSKISDLELTRSQRLAMLTNKISVAEAKELSRGQAIRKTITSTRALRIATLGLIGAIALLGFASIAAKADDAKKAIDSYNNVNKNGAKISENAQKTIDKYTEKLAGLTEGTKKYKQVSKQLEIAKLNKKDIDNANELLKTHNRLYDAQKASIEARREERFSDSLKLASDGKQLSTTSYEAQMQHAIDIRNKALDVYDSRLYKASQHINSQVSSMKEAGASEEKRVKYARDYQVEAENTARLWKEFNEGNLNSGFYAVLSELKLMWIDLWNNNHFTHFWNSVVKTWEDVKPTVYAIKDWLIGVGEALADFFSTDMGKFTLMAGGIGLVSLKIGKWVSGASSVFSVLKTVGGKVKDLAKGWKNVADNAEEASKKMPKGSDESMGTGGITPEGKKANTSWRTETWGKIKEDATTYARAAVGIAAGMFLITEAIFLLRAPMGALAELGWQFKQWEPNIRKGIEGLQLIAPTVISLLVPIMALVKVMDKWGSQIINVRTLGYTALGIAAGMLLVAEAIVMINAPMVVLAELGHRFKELAHVQDGITAIKTTSEALYALAPFIPVFLIGIGLVALAFTSGPIGILALGATAIGIATGMGLLTEAILTLHMPLTAIEGLGARYTNLDGVKRGAEAIKVTAEAMGYVEEATGLMALVKWELIASHIADIINNFTGVKLTDLTAEGGFFDQINDFVTEFNTKVTLTPIDTGKVDALNGVATGLGSVGTALDNAKKAIDNIPPELKNGEVLSQTSSVVYDGSQGGTTDTTSYFDQLKEPLKALSKFITEFNNGEYGDFSQGIDPAQIDAINTSANMLEQVKNAVQKVNDVMWNTGMGNNIATIGSGSSGFLSALPGGLGAIGGLFDSATDGTAGSGSSGGYVSSFGSQFQEVENIIKDLSTFSNNVSTLTSGDSNAGNVEALTTFVDGVKTQIDNLVTTLSDKVPQAKTNAKSLGTGIIEGIKSGLVNLTVVGTGIPAKVANGIMTNKETVYNTATSLGKTTANKFKTGVDKMSEMMGWELYYVNQQLTGEWYDKIGTSAYNLGQHASDEYKNGLDMHSPGLMARATEDEVGFIGNALTNNNLPQMAFNLAQSLGSNFKLDFGLSNLQLPNLSQFTQGLQVIPTTVGNIKTQVSTKFGEMKTGIQGSFNSILGKTKTSMANMKSATIGHISNIKTSWRGMQDALIASADHIKQQTGSKINQLKTNLGDFWNKIRHPDQLIGGTAGGKPQGSIRRRGRTGFAGSPLFKPKKSKIEPSDFIDKALLCQMQGEPCYAGWNFNWTKPITGKFKGWNTHFSKFGLDNFLNVGSFENSNFPVKGRADVFKAFIEEVIRGTTYDFYFNSKYGSPAEALRAGHFNCYDGMRIVMALASAFGLGASQSSGTWGGTPHSWATVQGIGAIDTTALQRGYGFTSPKVKGYHAGSIKRTGSNGDVPPSNNNSSNHNEVNIHIHGDVYGIDDLNKKIEEGANRVARRLFRNSLSGV